MMFLSFVGAVALLVLAIFVLSWIAAFFIKIKNYRNCALADAEADRYRLLARSLEAELATLRGQEQPYR